MSRQAGIVSGSRDWKGTMRNLGGSAGSHRLTLGLVLLALLLAPPALLLLGGASSSTPARLLSIEDREPGRLGASGVRATLNGLSTELAASLAQAAQNGLAHPIPAADLQIPPTARDAYREAASALAADSPKCGLRWTLLAGLGQVVSNHAQEVGLRPDGTTRRPILGPRLDGSPGVAKVPDTDDGRLDGDRLWDRAVGPFQFIPTVWRTFGTDNSGDGVADPNNIYDAALVAGRYLCAAEGTLRNPVGRARAVFSYHGSGRFVELTLRWALAYDATTVQQPATDLEPVEPWNPPATTPSPPPVAPAPPLPQPTPSPDAGPRSASEQTADGESPGDARTSPSSTPTPGPSPTGEQPPPGSEQPSTSPSPEPSPTPPSEQTEASGTP